MDGLFLSDEDIIGTNSDAFKSFNLDDEWGVSPGTTQFSLRSPELNFTSQNFLEKVNIVSEGGGDSTTVKQEIKEERSFPVHWFSVLENKEICKDNARNSFEERYLRAEQVVPDQINVMELANQKRDPLQNCNGNPCKLELTDHAQCSSAPTDMIHDNSLQSSVISKNSNPQIFTSNNKEQVNGYQHISYEQAPADDLFTFTLCDNQCFEQVTKQELTQEISDSDKPFNVDEKLSNVPQQAFDVLMETQEQLYSNGQLENETRFIQSNNSENLSREDTNDDSVFEDKKSCVDRTGGTEESLEVRQKMIKYLTPKRIPKCDMVIYSFDSGETLPCFADAFGHLVPKESDSAVCALPKVLESEESDKKEEEEDAYIVFSDDSDSECNSVEAKQETLLQPRVKIEIKSDNCLLHTVVQPAENIEVATGDELSSRFNNTAIREVECMDTSPHMLTLDDELENFLVSNMEITADQCRENSPLLDLSENLGCILRNDNLQEEIPLESVYRNLFSRTGVGIPREESNWNRQQRAHDENSSGNLLNAALLCSGAERGWQFSGDSLKQHVNRGNMNAIYGNIWSRNATNGTHPSHMGGRHLPNDRIFNAPSAESYTRGVRKNVLNLPSNVNRTENDNFEFGSTTTRVEVVDSSMNYNF